MKIMTRRALAAAALAGLALPLGTQSLVHAATVTWNGGGTDDNWSTGANWGGLPPVADDSLVFAGITRLTPVNDFSAGSNFSGITFNAGAGAFTLGGNPINLGGANTGVTVGNTAGMGITNGVTNSSTNLQTINFGLTLNPGVHTFGGGAGGLRLNGAFAHNAGGFANFTPGAGGITFSPTSASLTNGILGGWAITGTNWATLNAANQLVAYTNYANLSGGGVIASDPTANVNINTAGAAITLANPGGTTDVNTITYSASGAVQVIDVGSGNTLRLGKTGGIFRTATSGTTGALTIGTAAGSGSITAGGADGAAGELVFNTGGAANTSTAILVNSNVVDNVGGGALTLVKVGQADLQLRGTGNTYSGGTIISEGRLGVVAASIFGSGPVTVTGLGQAYINGAFTVNNNFFLSGIGTAEAGGHGAIRLQGGVNIAGTVTLTGNTRLSARGSTGTVSGQITGPFALELGGYNNDANSVMLITNPANNWTGNTTISENSTVRLGTNEVIPNGAAAGNLVINVGTSANRSAVLDLNGFSETINGLNRTGATGARAFIRNNAAGLATLTVGDNNASGAYDGNIQDNSGAGGQLAVTKIGSGLQSFGGTSLTYTGDTNINGGTLAINGPLTGAGAVNVNTATASSTLAGNGTISGNVTLAADNGANKARINAGPAGAGSAGTLTLNNLTINGGDLQFDLLTPGASDAINAPGTVTFNAASTISPTGGANGTYALLTSANPIVYGVMPTINSTPGAGSTRPATYTLDTASNSKAILLNVVGGAANLVWAGNVNSIWDLITTPNWKNTGNAGAADVFYNQDAVTFDDTSTNTADVQLIGQLSPGSISVNAARNYTFAGSGAISGNTGLTKDGAGTLKIANTGPNTFTGPIVITAGTLQVGGGSAVGSIPNVTVTNNATLVFNRSDNITYSGGISGSGNLEQRGPGLLILSGTNTYTGSNTVSGGTLKPSTAGALGATTTPIVVLPAGTFDVNGINLSTHPYFISGSGAAGVGALISTAAGQQLNAALNVTMTGDATIGGTGRFDIRGTGATLSTNGQPYKLTKIGANQFSLVQTTVDSALGDIDINDGVFAFQTTTNGLGDPNHTLTINTPGALNFFNTPATLDKKVVSNGGRIWTENANNNNIGNTGNPQPVTLNSTTTFQQDNNTTLTVNAPIGGAGGLLKTNPGTLILNLANSYSGTTTVSGGLVSVAVLADGGQPSGVGVTSSSPTNLLLAGGTLGYSGSTPASTDRQFTLGPGSGGLDASGGGGAPVTYTSTAPLTVAGNNPVIFTLAGSNTDANTLAAKIVNGGGTSALSLTKLGAGTWNLANPGNSYTGTTTVNGGLLNVTSLADGGSPSGIGASSSAPANLVLANGGALGFIGATAASSDRLFTLGNAGGELNASGAAGAAINFTNPGAIVLTGTTAANFVLSGTNTDPNAFSPQIVDGLAGPTTLTKNGAGTWVVSNPNHTFTGATTVNAGTLRVTGSIASSSGVLVTGGFFEASAGQTVQTLTLIGGDAVVSAPGGALKIGNGTATTPLQTGGGKVDLRSNGLVVDHPDFDGPSELQSVRQQIINAYNPSSPGAGDGNWQGSTGITSSLLTSPANANKAIGYGTSAELLGASGGAFMGQSVDGSAVLARYTLAGDANLSGKVDFSDLVALAQNYGADFTDPNNPNPTDSWWSHGDFNYDGKVSFTDLVKLAQNYGSALPTEPIAGAPAGFGPDLAAAFAQVPEPATLGGIAVLALGCTRRRRRQRRAP